MSDLSGKTVVVTGGANGIGLAIVRRLLDAGAQVAMLDLNAEALNKASADLPGKALRPYCVDVTDAARLREIADAIEAEQGPIEGLVTSAGTTGGAPAEQMTEALWRRILDINLTGTFLSCQAFARPMLARGRGAVVTISSASGLGGHGGRANYVAAKWGVIGLTKTLAIEWGFRGVRANCIAPGPVNTELYRKVPEDFREEVVIARTPLARAAEPHEVADAALFLLGPHATFIQGATLPVDGGFSSGYATRNSGADLAIA